jgi:RNA polymerase sigma-70 factor (ECF subfamily)
MIRGIPAMPNGVKSPSSHDEEFDRLMEGVRAGCPDAAVEVWRRYSGHVRTIVRRRLHQRMRPQYDSIDFLQDVWASFFAAVVGKCTFASPESLISFLSDLAFHKVTDEYRRRFRIQKNIRREQRLEAMNRMRKAPRYPPRRDPSPSQAAIANERWERLLKGQSDRGRLVLEMLRKGHTHGEIAERTGLHPKVIQRLLQKMAQRRDLP